MLTHLSLFSGIGGLDLAAEAICNGIYGYQQEYAKLPPAVQKAVGEPEQLKRWAVMPVDDVQAVVASNFQRSYRQIAQREREMAKIPADVRELLTGVSAAMLPEAAT